MTSGIPSTSPPERRIAAPALLLLVLALSIPACRGEAPSDDLPVRVAVAVAPTPPIVGPNRLVLDLTDDQGAALEATAVRIEGTMTHAGMVPVFDTATDQGGGRWVVPEFDFTMGGEWILIIRVELPDGREATRRHELSVVGRGGPAGMDGAR